MYERLSERMRNRFDIFDQLPDVLEDDWISARGRARQAPAKRRMPAKKSQIQFNFQPNWDNLPSGDFADAPSTEFVMSTRAACLLLGGWWLRP